ncbi:MAG: protein-disulfide reductase DsbD family protein [Ignavibacteriaceae bacterium]|jgi:DsbC/DsbD-like thiol-disulfide interchange protein
MKIRLLKVLLIFVFLSRLNFSQDTPDKIVDVKLSTITKSIETGSVVNLALLLNIKEGWHINSNKPLDPNLVPTAVNLKDTSAYKLKEIKYPQPELKKLAFSENELSLYEYEAVIKIQIVIDKNYSKKNLIIKGKIQYQPCNDQTCLFPFSKDFSVNLKINDK